MKPQTSLPPERNPVNRSPLRRGLLGVGAVIVLLVLAMILLPYGSGLVSAAKWITISYADLLPKEAIIRTGESLATALHNPSLRNAVQPFVDRYSELLPSALELTNGGDKVPFHNVVDFFPISSRQPAWVAILRGGRIYVSTDDNGHAKVFLLGDDPERAYRENYPVIRHCLSMLLRHANGELQVDAYAYHNDYQTSELRFNTTPYSLHAASFDSEKSSLDLDGLADFFAQGAELRGATVNKNHGLILYGCAGAKQTLAGEPVELSDLAVAYRAVFHAGDNEAFISLDPNEDATKVTVNFGGFLEHTRIGAVVLEADKRFKTITSGLDPNSFQDRRAYTRTYVHSFLSGSERNLLNGEMAYTGKWIGTRFWYYPDTIGVDSDLSYENAVITNPRFTADAERSREDFLSPEEFERKKRETLSPSIRDNIEDLNLNYAKYAQAFPEISELTTVARLMGICSWLLKARTAFVDCDTLLNVEVPAFKTESERTQLIEATYFTHSSAETPTRKQVTENATLVFLSPILDKTVEDFFQTPINVAKYLSGSRELSAADHAEFDSEANRLFDKYRDSKVRELANSKRAVELLADYAAGMVEPPRLASKENLRAQIETGQKTLEKLASKIEQLKRQISTQTYEAAYNALVDQHNQLVSQHERILQAVNNTIDTYNTLRVDRPFILGISGGIDLEASKFAIRQDSLSPKLIEFRNLVRKVGPKWTQVGESEKWISSEKASNISQGVPRSRPNQLDFSDVTQQVKRWASIDPDDGSWKEAVKIDGIRSVEKSYDSTKQQLQVASFASGRLESLIIGQKDSNGRIVFHKSDRKNVLPKDF